MALPSTVSAQELGDCIGLSDRRIRQLTTSGVFAKSARNAYAFTASLQAYWAWKEAGIRGEYTESEDSSEARFERERARLTAAKADKAEIEAALLKGTVHEANAVAMVMNDMLASFRARVLSIPTKTAPLTADATTPAECLAIIKAECDSALTALADYDPRPVVDRIRKARESQPDEPEPEETKSA